MFVQLGITGTLTMQLMQNYDLSAETAYYFFAVWGAGLTLGNLLSAFLRKCVSTTILVAFIGLMGSLLLIRPIV